MVNRAWLGTNRFVGALSLVMAVVSGGAASAQMRITEYMYSGNGASAEFVEFTNIGGTSIDMTGWSYDDDSRTPGSAAHRLSARICGDRKQERRDAKDQVKRS